MTRRLGHEDLGAAHPHQHQTIAPVVGLELPDVGDELLRQILLVLALLDVRAIEPLHVLAIEDRGHRLDRRELVLHLIEELVLEHAGVLGRLVAVVLENVPAPEDQLVVAGERNEFTNLRRSVLRSLSKPDRAHLGERSNGFRDAFSHRHDARNCCRGNRAETNEQNAEFPLGGFDS